MVIMLGQLIDPLYPPIGEREPLPWLYMPGIFAALILGYSLGPGAIRSGAISLLLLLLVLMRPGFTLGSPSMDYSLAGFPIMWLLLFQDLGAISSPRYVGRSRKQGQNGGGLGHGDLKTWPQRLKWAARLATTTRGIGWDWQVKGVPAHPDADQSRWIFVGMRLVDIAWRSALKALAVYGIGFCQAVQPSLASPVASQALDVVINWCGAAWGWNTIGLAHAAGAALTVALGISEPWEWPPMLDSLWNAWSVRQMWSSAYHQILRRPLQQPGVRIARLIGFKKGTLASRYFQLYLAFFISFSIHWWQQYTITRRDQGEFRFFMTQPVVITIEDFIQWTWGKTIEPNRKESFRSFELLVGYLWTCAAFTLTIHPYVKGMAGTGVIGGSSPDESAALWLGQQHGVAYLQA